jgi:hypothetical protein
MDEKTLKISKGKIKIILRRATLLMHCCLEIQIQKIIKAIKLIKISKHNSQLAQTGPRFNC